MNRLAGILLLAAAIAWGPEQASGQDPVRLATTTTVEESGLLDNLLEAYARDSGETVRVIVRGTGEAIALARRGDVDLILVHDTEAERNLVADGGGSARADVMYNDFVIVGPGDDPVAVKTATDAATALQRIADSGTMFISRGDNSGTHRRERELWAIAGRDPQGRSDAWYLESGSGQGATLNIASARLAYALTDRGTWLAFRNKDQLRILFAGDPLLKNVYGLVLVDPDRHDGINAAGARRLADWLLSEPGQKAIAAYRIDDAPAFRPAASNWEE
ncbi:MAG: solute-binding protein [Alphaproteobacteria bacterium]|nr:solute-binding protein [Alphaproteobacteria bacterium]